MSNKHCFHEQLASILVRQAEQLKESKLPCCHTSTGFSSVAQIFTSEEFLQRHKWIKKEIEHAE